MWKHLKLVDEGKYFTLDDKKINWRMTYFKLFEGLNMKYVVKIQSFGKPFAQELR